MNNIHKLMGHYESGAKRKVHSTKCFHGEVGETKSIDLTAHLKALEQEKADTPKRSSWLEIVKLRTRINKTLTKRTIQRINKIKSCFLEKINNIDKLLSKLTKRQRKY